MFRCRRGFTRQPENSKRAHFTAPALQTPPKFHERTPRERKKKENCGGKRKKKREILGSPTLRGSTLRGPNCCAIVRDTNRLMASPATIPLTAVWLLQCRQVHQNPHFIKNHFHHKTTFITKPLSSQNHFHHKTTFITKPLSSEKMKNGDSQ